MAGPDGNITVDGNILTLSGTTINILAGGIATTNSSYWVYSGSKIFIGLSTTQGATQPDTGLAVGDSFLTSRGINYYFYSVEREEDGGGGGGGSLTVTYKGSTIHTASASGSATLNTAGKYMEDNVNLSYTFEGGIDPSDATATASDILSGKTAYTADGKVTGNIATKTSTDLSANGATVTAPAGYYASAASKSVASGTEGTPTATKGTVSNHAVTVTPSVTNSAGYIAGGTKTGTAVSVSASELVSGTKSITSSGTTDVTNYTNVSVASGSATTPATAITANPTVTKSGGNIVATVSKTQSITPTVSAGYVSSGTAGNATVSGSATVAATSLDANLVAGNIKKDVAIFGVTGSYEGGGGGGGSVEPNDVNFYDYDGTIVAAYSASDFANLSALPANPSHSGLTAQGWNWTLSDAKTYVASYGKLNIGQMYVTSDGKTRIYIHLEDGRLAPYLGIAINGTATVDWGDGTTSTVTGSSTSTVISTQHTYAAAGDYVIAIAVSGSMALVGSNGSRVLWKNSTTGNLNRAYQNAIQKVEIGANTSLANGAFANCYSLASITIPNSVTSIYPYVFANCYSLASITIPNSVTSVSDSVFDSCYSLVSITIPNSVTSIYPYVFANCYSLASITIPSGISMLGDGMFANCYSLASITIPSGASYMGMEMFSYCHSLASITMPSSVYGINDYMFANCYSLASITIPSGATFISGGVFDSCYGLGYIKFESTTPPVAFDYSAWNSIPTDCIIYVPRGSLSAYTSNYNYPSSSTYTYVEYDP